MEEINTILAYNDSLKIIQEKGDFNFSIDSCLLSFFIEFKRRDKNVIDLGTGTGSIPLFISMLSDSMITGVEIDKSRCDKAKRSVELNNLENRINIINEDIKNLNKLYNSSSFDICISNPPYFKIEDTLLKNKSDDVSIARHEILITLEDIIKEAKYLLKDNGRFYLVLRSERFIEAIRLLESNNLMPKRVRFVYPSKDKESHIFLLEAIKNSSEKGFRIMNPLYIYDEKNDFSDEVLSYYHYGENDEKRK